MTPSYRIDPYVYQSDPGNVTFCSVRGHLSFWQQSRRVLLPQRFELDTFIKLSSEKDKFMVTSR